MKLIPRSLLLITILLAVVLYATFFSQPAIKDAVHYVLVIMLGAIALFQDEFKRQLAPAELTIDLKLDSHHCAKTPFFIQWQTDGPTQQISTEAYYLKANVTNEGKSQARLCEVFISDLEEETEGIWKKVSYFQQVNLKWATGRSNDPYIHINPGISFMVDLGLIIQRNTPDKRTDVFWIDYLYRIGGYQPEYLEPNKTYRFCLLVSSENAKLVSVKYKFKYTGKWKHEEEDMHKEIAIALDQA